MNEDPRPVGDPTRGQKTRDEIVARALHMAAKGGFAAISIGTLAKELNISKSGLFAHFGSKENLEVAVVERARVLFHEHILVPIEEAGLEGVERVWALCDNWLEFVQKPALPGGYFFSGAFFLCVGQDGSIPNQIMEIMCDWIITLREALDGARKLDQLQSTVDAERTALELNAILIGAQWSYLMGYKNRKRPRAAILAMLGRIATENIPPTAFDSVREWKNYLEDIHTDAQKL